MAIEIGKTASFQKAFSDEDVRLFAGISLDDNPIHLDEEYAQKSMFGQKIVHGMLVASLVSKVFGTIFPGPGCIYLGQTLKFLKPVYINQPITATVVLTEYDEQTRKGVFKTTCTNTEGDLVIVGDAKILFNDAAKD